MSEKPSAGVADPPHEEEESKEPVLKNQFDLSTYDADSTVRIKTLHFKAL